MTKIPIPERDFKTTDMLELAVRKIECFKWISKKKIHNQSGTLRKIAKCLKYKAFPKGRFFSTEVKDVKFFFVEFIIKRNGVNGFM